MLKELDSSITGTLSPKPVFSAVQRCPSLGRAFFFARTHISSDPRVVWISVASVDVVRCFQLLLLLLSSVPEEKSSRGCYCCCCCCVLHHERVALRFPNSFPPFLPIRQDDYDDDDDNDDWRRRRRRLARVQTSGWYSPGRFPTSSSNAAFRNRSHLLPCCVCFIHFLGITANWWLGVDVRRFCCWLFLLLCCLLCLQIPLCGQYAILVQLWVLLYQYGCENWFGGSSKAKRSTAFDSWDRSPSTWDWYSAI